MVTTIQISEDLLERLKIMKMHEKESYEDILWGLLEDSMELSEETRESIKEYEKAVKKGERNKFKKFEDIKKELK
ncbi:hypothetical protein COX99_00920 [Candidatus Pacearchaeota archaeon CG_4_10_14_0_2_um_filter_31_10]|nr:MAG: hypothetical protein COU55_02075 [Candidatus Pacearchaeota archaeon CG10_big_fil_rev_8_21_14_0_10_31_59]PIZ81068.1 MAG: hypothetical protein COX99_00920 [Candidatus Pacearchaeota archaeon CG_4_10_14_0_2_um_filter_31_10]